jgi:alkylated DNA repair protein (DNA oxidative demethylase)
MRAPPTQASLPFEAPPRAPSCEPLDEGVVLLRGFASPAADELARGVEQVCTASPLRHMLTPGGQRMSVAMTNCGPVGWVSDRAGYRYQATDPLTGNQWPALPSAFLSLSAAAAERAGFRAFRADACLINRYEPGARMSLHQDKDERDFTQPIVSVSLGVPAVFQLGGSARSGAVQRVPLEHGDVVVWGGVARLRYHGVLTLKPAQHVSFGAARINLTFRKAL